VSATAAAAAAGGSGGLQVHSIKDWVMSAEVADEYAAWGNRLLLAGDAAHR
jgi:2-polyprenyl-6-methoxyphenol hydroxylase-like FAD-dependent oxidoreductase